MESLANTDYSDVYNYKDNFFNKNLDIGNETRSQILIAAFNEIYKCGFQAASINAILKNTGITKGALYHHFKNKNELGYHVLDEVIRPAIRSIWIEPLKVTDDPVTVLIELIEISSKNITPEDVRLGCPLNNLAQEMSPIDEGFRCRIVDIYQEWQDTIEVACDRGIAAANMSKSIDSKEISLLYIASVQGCLSYAKSIQELDIIINCGQCLIDRIELLRPSKKSIKRR